MEVNAQSLQSSILNLDVAFKNFFKSQSKYPKFKSKDSKQSFQYPQLVKVDQNNNLVYLPKIGWVKCKFDRDIIGKIKTCTVSKTSTNKYYISILLETEVNEVIPTVVDENNSIGIDVGIKDFSTLSNGEKISNPKYLFKSKKRLAKEQKILSRKSKSSNNYKRQKLKVDKLHEKVSNQRLDFQHKLSHKLVYENQETSFMLEDLSVSDMMQNKKLSYLISDCAWYQFYTLLKYKSERNGKNVIKINRYFPSSKTCSFCGYQLSRLSLQTREWTCPDCDTIHDRDINAAKNILKQGFIEAY